MRKYSLGVRSGALASITVLALAVGCHAFLSTSLAEPRTPTAFFGTIEHVSVDPAKLFDAVVETVDRHFVDEKLLRDIDWRARATAMRQSVLSAASAEMAADRINGLLSELKTSHTELFSPDDYRYYITLDALRGAPSTASLISNKFWGSGPYFPGIGAFTRTVEGRHFVDDVMEGSPADRAGLKFGDEILSVDGAAYSPIAVFRGKIGRIVALEVRRERDTRPMRIDVPVIPISPSTAFSVATQASARVAERNGRRIGYIHVWSVNEARSFRAALASLDSAYSVLPSAANTGMKRLDSLIVDMRGRVGGNVGTAGQLLDMLGAREKPYWGTLQVAGRSELPKALPQLPTIFGGPPVRPFQGRSAILINHQTRSAGEIMAHGYKRSGVGVAIGTQTAGAVSGGALHVMPGGFLLYVAATTLDFDDVRLEGTGVAPDHRVDRPLPYAAGVDPVFDAAVDHLAGGSLQ